ncbi:helix-turn-helix domain-containing protein [Pseudonocardiaceae bacterium YIM PH 21723]|nr:helix-turn-helix domain-containing protein [Pseudonocardiaceae bacterium YIM PH 21723]
MTDPTGARSFAEKLNRLFEVILDGRLARPYRNAEVASAITARGTTISDTYIGQLRSGRKDNPTLRHVEALAEFFGVPAAYFLNDNDSGRIEQQLRSLEEAQGRAKGSEAKLMALRAAELSTQGRKQVMDMLDTVYQLEQIRKQQGDA